MLTISKKNIPNILTIARIISIPFFVFFLLSGRVDYAFYIFVLAGITDGLDGFIARHFDMRTKLGLYLDPAADKLLIQVSFIALGILGQIPLLLVILVFSRDFIIFIGVIILRYFLSKDHDVTPTLIGKLNTISQITLISLILLKLYLQIFQVEFGYLVYFFIGATTIFTIVSGGQYILRGIQALRE